MSQAKVSANKVAGVMDMQSKETKGKKMTEIRHYPCQQCKTDILRLIGVFKLDATTTKVNRTS
ncbi:hypothetical protein NI376_23185 [Pseudoalteromonas piscicida]|nr:hypothetical protein [Pseudoalteromonas piscicida]WMO16131.1 hypothetical protein NI376_23185 [Pseudoalteromonas piscicida]